MRRGASLHHRARTNGDVVEVFPRVPAAEAVVHLPASRHAASEPAYVHRSASPGPDSVDLGKRPRRIAVRGFDTRDDDAFRGVLATAEDVSPATRVCPLVPEFTGESGAE